MLRQMQEWFAAILLAVLCLIACNYKSKDPERTKTSDTGDNGVASRYAAGTDREAGDSLRTDDGDSIIVNYDDSVLLACHTLSEAEAEVLKRVDAIFREVEAFMRQHRNDLDDKDPRTGRPYSDQLDTDRYLSAEYLALSEKAAEWWYGPLYEHWLQSLKRGTTWHTTPHIELFAEGDSALVYLILKGIGDQYSREKQELIQVHQEKPLTLKMVREHGEWLIDDFRTKYVYYCSEKDCCRDIIAFTPFRGSWISCSGDPKDGYHLTDHEICSNLDVKAQKLYSYELHHDTLQIDEVIYDDANRIQKVPATTRYATVNSTHDTLTIRQKGMPVRRYIPSK